LSNPAAANASARPDEPVALTVHSVGLPPAAGARRRSGRLTMLLVLLACAAPVIVSYFTYYVIRPEGRTNYGTLVEPGRDLPPALAGLKGQWLLVLATPSACDAACEKQLFMQRQLREMLGRERDRLDKVWLVLDDGDIAPALRDALAQGVPATVVRAPRAEVERWLAAGPGQPVEPHLHVVDPMGRYMMRMPADPEPARVKRDLERLLRASASWDRAGR
jgi:hypothetical protein